MKYLAVFGLLVLSCGALIRAEAAKSEEEDVPIEEVHDEAVVNTKRLVKYKDKIPIPMIIDPKDSVNLRKRYCYCFQFKCRVRGMENGTKGWSVQNQQGYVVVSGNLYRFYRCDIPKRYRRGR